MSLWSFLKNPKLIEELNSLRYFLNNLKTLILKMMVVSRNLNSLTSLANFSLYLILLKNCPRWYATFIIPLFFVLIISSYCLNIFTASSGPCVSSAYLLRSPNSTTSYIVIESNNFFFISFLDKRFAFFLSPKAFHSINKK